MQVPVQITFRDIPSSEAIEARIHEEAEKLEKIHDNITSCRVVIESPHHSHKKGNLYHTAIYLSVPGGDIEVTKDNRKDRTHEDAYISIRDSFREAARQLTSHLDKRRNQVKTHTS
ncbi:MAG: ribosome-associated translation inhibitor RaiA [Alphaproteobacteria bacterium]|jgi:ribosome-associated translation inhibitor RaiA|nr:ribosome-associated translation inhibitor RaiA [Alphaproteobacteria bacterium]MBT5859920.1 ribosome-associated translation inhibitor RaiA [Alphaproteobacteria bacterium]